VRRRLVHIHALRRLRGWHALSLRRACVDGWSTSTPFEDSGRATRATPESSKGVRRRLVHIHALRRLRACHPAHSVIGCHPATEDGLAEIGQFNRHTEANVIASDSTI